MDARSLCYVCATLRDLLWGGRVFEWGRWTVILGGGTFLCISFFCFEFVFKYGIMKAVVDEGKARQNLVVGVSIGLTCLSGTFDSLLVFAFTCLLMKR